jgi:hypothetical protein
MRNCSGILRYLPPIVYTEGDKIISMVAGLHRETRTGLELIYRHAAPGMETNHFAEVQSAEPTDVRWPLVEELGRTC